MTEHEIMKLLRLALGSIPVTEEDVAKLEEEMKNNPPTIPDGLTFDRLKDRLKQSGLWNE